MRPSLTAAARDGRTIVRVGTEEWLRRGPNQRMARHRRATCRQIRSPNPKLSPLHGTGARPQPNIDAVLRERTAGLVKHARELRTPSLPALRGSSLLSASAKNADSGHRDQPIRLIVITQTGDRDHAAHLGRGGAWRAA